MRVNSARDGQHGGLGPQPDGPETAHVGSLLAGPRQLCEKPAQCLGAGLQHGRIHVGVAASIDVAHETRLGPYRQLVQQRENRLVGDQLGNQAALAPLRVTGRPDRELGCRAHGCSLVSERDAMSISRTPFIDFATTLGRSVAR